MNYVLAKKDSCEMNKVQAELFIKSAMVDIADNSAVDMNIITNNMHVSESECPMGMRMIFKRISAMNLPIKLTYGAVMCFDIFPNQAGGVIVMLIDALQNFENKLVTAKDIASIYPDGFYTPKALTERIESFSSDTSINYREVY